jgi:hypothetical protein
VPVLGANLPRGRMRAAMGDAALDQRLPMPRAGQAARGDPRRPLRPAAGKQQLGPMVRVQVARDIAMARTIEAAVAPGKTVVLLAGAGHVDAALGVPRHLPARLVVRPVLLPRTGEGPLRRITAPACAGRSAGRPEPARAGQAWARMESASVFTSWSMCDFSTM